MTSVKLDKIDIRILSILQREGRITKVALAERVQLSPTPCWERLKRLEQAGLIAGYHARLSLRAAVRFATIFTQVTLQRHRQEDFASFERAVLRVPEIVECWAVGGGIDYLLKVVTHDIDSYQAIVAGLLEQPIGIDQYFTYVVTKPVKQDGVPVEVLLGAW
jgi:Lrp/AsnC family transcriptional regulator of ectoine degradation